MLTTDQLAALRFGNLTTARHRLAVLVRLGVLRRFRPRRETGTAPWDYVLGPIGAAMLGQEDRDEKKWLSQVRADRQLALERSQRLGHMTGASWFFVALARHTREHGGGELRKWASERETAEYLYHGPGSDSSPHPDGLGIWAEGSRDIAFLLEYDTGSEHLPQLAAKLPGYADLARYPAYLAFRMPILFCFPPPAASRPPARPWPPPARPATSRSPPPLHSASGRPHPRANRLQPGAQPGRLRDHRPARLAARRQLRSGMIGRHDSGEDQRDYRARRQRRRAGSQVRSPRGRGGQPGGLRGLRAAQAN